ncbi:hypothetical protein MCOR25_008147 [Pyricularia grisea]|nr:hypothetical protein MCOR25_008147 [Pyricularia grisea]
MQGSDETYRAASILLLVGAVLVAIVAAIATIFNALRKPSRSKPRRRRQHKHPSQKQQALTWQPWSRPSRPPVWDLEAGRMRRGAGAGPGDNRSPPPYDAQQPRKWQHIRRWRLGVASDTEITAVEDAHRDGDVRPSPVPPARLSGSRGWSSV